MSRLKGGCRQGPPHPSGGGNEAARWILSYAAFVILLAQRCKQSGSGGNGSPERSRIACLIGVGTFGLRRPQVRAHRVRRVRTEL